jgi:FPC/CPF motif-containing protein YcgG
VGVGVTTDTILQGACHGLIGGKLVRLRPRADQPDALGVLLHGQIQGILAAGACACLPSPDAVPAGAYRLGIYPTLTSAAAVAECAADLRVLAAYPAAGERSRTLLAAVFDGPVGVGERVFDGALDRWLCRLRDTAAARVEPVPDGPGGHCRVVSVAGHVFRVTALHAAASDWAHRFGWPTLIFDGGGSFRGKATT